MDPEIMEFILKQIRQLTADFTPPADACTCYQSLFSDLEDFEADLFKHVHKENNILFPRVIARQSGLFGLQLRQGLLGILAQGDGIMPLAQRLADMLRPFPARFIARAPNRHSTNLHRLKFSFLKRPHFVRLFEAPDQKIVVVRQHL